MGCQDQLVLVQQSLQEVCLQSQQYHHQHSYIRPGNSCTTARMQLYTYQHSFHEIVMFEDCKVHKVWKMFDCSKKSVWNILRCVWVVMQGREMNDHHVWMSTPGPGGGTLAAEQLQLDQLISDKQRENYIYKCSTFFCLQGIWYFIVFSSKYVLIAFFNWIQLIYIVHLSLF